jgi:hypothetical protein
VVPGATVVVRNIATGVSHETVSNSTGNFSVPALDAGSYDATVSLSGFKTFKVDKIVLTPGNTSSISVKLEVGAASETVNVQAKTELIETSSTSVSATISADQIRAAARHQERNVLHDVPAGHQLAVGHARPAQLDGAGTAGQLDLDHDRRHQRPGPGRAID